MRHTTCITNILLLSIALPWMIASSTSTSQIRIVGDTQISQDNASARHVESVLKVNPLNPANLVAASIVFDQQMGVAVYSTEDGGKNWMRAVHGPNNNLVFGGIDPALTFDLRGNVYLITDELVVWKSSDAGKTWTESGRVPGRGYDRPFIACDRDNNVYVSGKMPITVLDHPGTDAVVFTRSTDGGATFSFPKLILPPPGKEFLNVVSDLLVTPDGRIFLALQTFHPHNGPLLAGSYSILISADGGQSFSKRVTITEFRSYGHANEGKSLFGLGQGYLAMDTSSEDRNGWVYFTWLDVIDGYYQVMASVSSDGGNTWSSPVQLSEPNTKTDSSNPAIAVNENGTVGIVWNDRRKDPTDRCYQLYLGASIDGGKTFTSRPVSEEFTCPIGKPADGNRIDPDSTVDPIQSQYRFKNGGDTQGIVGLSDGMFHLAWIHGGSGELQLRSTVVQTKE